MKYAFPDNFWWAAQAPLSRPKGQERGNHMGLLVCPRAEPFSQRRGAAAHLHVLSKLENGHSAVKAAEPQQLSYLD